MYGKNRHGAARLAVHGIKHNYFGTIAYTAISKFLPNPYEMSYVRLIVVYGVVPDWFLWA